MFSSMKFRFCPIVLGAFLAVFVFSRLLSAQGGDANDDQGDAPAQKIASLSLRVDENGVTHFNLSNSTDISAMADVRSFFVSRWNCTIERLDVQRQFGGFLTAEQKSRIQSFRKEAEGRSLAGMCRGPMQRHGLVVEGTFDFQPLLEILHGSGVENLNLRVSLPDIRVKGMQGPAAVSGPALPGIFQYKLAVAAPTVPLRIAFGYSRSELLWLAFYTALFVIVPVTFVFIVRAAALRRGGSDPAAAWFSFMRTMQFCVNGTFLLWGLTHLNTRSQISELFTFLEWTSGWRGILAQVLLFTVPSWTTYLLCTALSYKVFLRIRSVSWTWSQFMARQLASMGKVFFPLTLYIAGFFTIVSNFRAGVALVALAWLTYLLCVQLHARLEKNHPSAVTSGPLRDRIFGLAQHMGVKVQQVFVVPTARSGVANAFATTKQTVLLTDYLLEKLSQREVDAVAAHELTHLRHKHAQKLTFMLVGCMVLPGMALGFIGGFVEAFLFLTPVPERLHLAVLDAFASNWAQAVVMLVSFWFYYFIQKKFEYTADAGAVHATQDPEAMITALAKISRLNLMPLQWSRSSEAMLTHPSTMRRLQRIASLCAMPESHLQHLIAQSEKEPEQVSPVATGYAVVPSATVVVSTATNTGRTQLSLLILMALHVVPPAAILFCFTRFAPVLGSNWLALAVGAALSVCVYQFGLACLSASNNRHMAKNIMKTMAGKTGPFSIEQGIPVGFAPTPSPRFFVSGYNWDQGLLFLTSDKAVFIGGHASFGLRRDQIRSVLLGPGAPSWNNWQRIYFSWEDKQGGSGTFNLLPLRRTGLFRIDSRNLYLRVRAWRNAQSSTALDGAVAYGPPAFGPVTSMSPKEVNKFSRTFSITLVMLGLAMGLSFVLKLERSWYLVASILLVRLFESIPSWRYRERPLVYAPDNAPALSRPSARIAAPPPPPPPRLQVDQEPVGVRES